MKGEKKDFELPSIPTTFPFIPTGAFKTIRSAHVTSSNASARIAGSSGLLAESLEKRRNAEELESRLLDPDSGFEVLQNKMAVAPNLTPVINKVKLML